MKKTPGELAAIIRTVVANIVDRLPTQGGAIVVLPSHLIREISNNVAQEISGGYDIIVHDETEDDCNTCGGGGTVYGEEGDTAGCPDCFMADPDGRERTEYPGVYSY